MKINKARLVSLIAILIGVAFLGAWQYKLLWPTLWSGEGSAPDEMTLLEKMQQADQIKDPFERCLTYPQPTGIEWSQAMIEAFCADEFTPIPGYWPIFNRIDEGRGLAVDEIFDNIVSGYFEGQLPEGTLWESYYTRFYNDGEGTRKLIRDWSAQSPDSAHAKVAMGLHYLLVGERARGGKVISETAPEHIERMKRYVGLAIEELEKGLALDSRIMPAYSALITASKYAGGPDLADSAYERALAIDPKTFYVRATKTQTLEPRWGGSYSRMLSVAVEGNEYIDSNPRMPNLFAIVYGTRGHDVYFYNDNPSDHDAMIYYEKSVGHGPLFKFIDFAAGTAKDLGDNARAVELYSQYLRFSPGAARIRRSRAIAISRLGMRQWALSEFQHVLSQTPNDKSALNWYAWLLSHTGDHQAAARYYGQLLALDPDNQKSRRHLAHLYLYKLRQFDLAGPLIEGLLEDDPERGAYWLLQTDFLRNTGKPGVEDTARKFLRYADDSDAEQRAAIPKVEQWLSENYSSIGAGTD